MLLLNKSEFIKDTLITFNYCYDPYRVITPEEVTNKVSTITERLEYYNCFNLPHILRELIQVMRDNNYNVLNHYTDFKPINLVKLLSLLGLDIKDYYSEGTLWNPNYNLTKNQNT